MALVKCRECKGEVSKKADTCPHCGAKLKSQNMGCGSLILVIIIGVVLYSIFTDTSYTPHHDTDSSNKPASSKDNTVKNSTSLIEAKPGDQWLYSSDVDKMSDKQTRYASVQSTNYVNFGFPYSGAQRATLTLRTHPRYGKSLIFQIERGQILCNSYNDCTVLIRFDSSNSIKYKAAEPTDNSSETIFIRDYHSFVSKMLKAKTVRISVEIYQEGNHVFEFNVNDFSIAKYLPKK